MIALDTNVLVRLLVDDDAAQGKAALDLLVRCHDAGRRCLVTLVVLCELEWVLDAAYKVPRGSIADALAKILLDPGLEIESRPVVEGALEQYRQGKGDLSDYLLGARAAELGAETMYTFDRGLRRVAGFTLLA